MEYEIKYLEEITHDDILRLPPYDRDFDEHFDVPKIHRNRPIQPNPRSFRKGS